MVLGCGGAVQITRQVTEEYGLTGADGKARRSTSRVIAIRLLSEMAPMAQGIHFMPLGWSDLVPLILAGLPHLGPASSESTIA